MAAFLQEERIFNVRIVSFEFEDEFIPHGKVADVEKNLGLDVDSISENILKDLP